MEKKKESQSKIIIGSKKSVVYKDKVWVNSIGDLSFWKRLQFLFAPQIEIKSVIETENEIGRNHADVKFRPITYLDKLKAWWRNKFPPKGGMLMAPSSDSN